MASVADSALNFSKALVVCAAEAWESALAWSFSARTRAFWARVLASSTFRLATSWRWVARVSTFFAGFLFPTSLVGAFAGGTFQPESGPTWVVVRDHFIDIVDNQMQPAANPCGGPFPFL